MRDMNGRQTTAASLASQWVVFALSMLVAAGIFIRHLHLEYTDADTGERQRLATQARVVGKNMARQLDSVNRALENIRNDLPYWEKRKDGRERLIRRLKAMTEAMVGVNSMAVLDAQGRVVASSLEKFTGQQFSQRSYYLIPQQNPDPDTLYVSPPFKNVLGIFSIALSRAIVGPDGRFGGVVVASLEPEEFSVLLDSVRYAPDMRVSLVHGGGMQFMALPEDGWQSGTDLAAKPDSFFTRHMRGGQPVTLLTGSLPGGGAQRMVALRTIRPAELRMNQAMVVAVERDLPAVFAEWRREAWEGGGLLAILVLTSGAALFFYQRRQRALDALEARHEAERREMTERLRLATEASGAGVWEYDCVSGEQFWDDAMYALYGVRPEEFVADYQAWQGMILPEDLAEVNAAIGNAVEHGTPYDICFHIRRRDGQVRAIHALGKVIFDEAGKPLRAVGTNQDVTERRQAEDLLHFHSEILLNLSEGVFLIRARDGEIVFANPQFERMFGYAPGELIGRPVSIVNAPGEESPEEVAARIIGELERAGRWDGEVRNVRKDGSVFCCHASVRAFDHPHFGRVWVSVHEDITERKNSEEQLRQSKEKLRAYLDNISDTIWVIGANLDIVYVSPSVVRLLGIPPGELTGRPSALVIHPDDMATVTGAQRYVMEHPGEPHTVQYRVGRKDGGWVDVESTGVNMLGNPAISGVLVTMRDVTERKRVEAALQASEASMHAILDNFPHLAWLKDAEGRYIQVNKGYADYVRREPQQIIGRTDLDLWPAELAEKYRSDDAVVMASRRQKRVEEPSLDGDRIHWVETFKTPVIGADGKLLGTAGFACDITERKAAEDALRESESRFREIFNAVSDAIFIHDAETGRILDVNRRMCEMYGMTREEALACGPDDLSAGVPPYSTAEAVVKLQLARTAGPQTFEWLARGRDGRFFWVEVGLRFAYVGSQQRILATVRDISDRKHMDAELRIAAIAFESQDGMLVSDADSVILRVNHAFSMITGYTAEEVVGQTPRLFKSGRHDAAFYAAMWESIRRSGNWHGEIWNRRKSGEIYPEQLTITAVRGERGEISHYVATMRDITERKAIEQEIHTLAFYDALTGLPNRRLLDDRIRQAMVASRRSGLYGALMFLDLDNFKPLNDTYGHDAGDLLLNEAAHRIASCVRGTDTVARFGGDEFVVVLSELDADGGESVIQARTIAEKICAALAEPYALEFRRKDGAEASIEHRCTSSIGVALFIDQKASPEDVLKWADIAMYQAKGAGRNRVHFHGT